MSKVRVQDATKELSSSVGQLYETVSKSRKRALEALNSLRKLEENARQKELELKAQEDAKKAAATAVAVPGTSEHQLGLAVDIVDTGSWKLDEFQADLPAQQWLIANGWEYGFILRYPEGKTGETGIIYEPWHYRYVGKELAKELHELDMTLEAYLDSLN